MSEGMVEICRSRVPAGTFEVANMLDWEPPPDDSERAGEGKGTYDGIVASLSIFELSKVQIEGMIGKWSRWLKPSGYLFIATCDPEEWGVEAEMYDEDGCVEGARAMFLDHVVANTLFTGDGWRRVLKGKGGFEVVKTVGEEFKPGANEVEPRFYIIARKEGG